MLVAGGLGGVILARRVRLEPPPLPPPPVITVARGELPRGVVAFEEHVQRGDGYGLSGSGFLLELPNGDVVGVAAAHSVGGVGFSRINFVRAGETQPLVTF